MESSQLTGDNGEECNSNESGWTMYLASPGSSDDDKANDRGASNVEDGSAYSSGRSKEDNENYSDGDYDSLASDASTGPAQGKVLNGKEKKAHGKMDGSRDKHSKDEKGETHTKLSTSGNKKASRTKKGEEKTARRGYNKKRSSSQTSF
ncbi:hypothetical protein EJB05_43408, partial [Eragrostis curvula]